MEQIREKDVNLSKEQSRRMDEKRNKNKKNKGSRWIRKWRILRHKMVNEPLPPGRVAGGWALGMFIGCAIPFGMQLVVSVPLSVLMKVSKVGATVGTLITNPFTIFIIYPAQTWVGCMLMGRPLSWAYLCEQCDKLGKISLLSKEGWSSLVSFSGEILGGFFLGGFLLALIMTPPTYFFVKGVVTRFRAAKASRARSRPAYMI